MEEKIMFVSSSGGHLSELLQFSKIMKETDILITENIGDLSKISSLGTNIRVKTLKAGSRKQGKKFILIFLQNAIRSFFMYWREKPSVIISTGSHTFIPFMLSRRIFFWRRCTVIYIESIARVKTLSKTGEMSIQHVDEFYVQWPELYEKLKDEHPHVQYKGRLL